MSRYAFRWMSLFAALALSAGSAWAEDEPVSRANYSCSESDFNIFAIGKWKDSNDQAQTAWDANGIYNMTGGYGNYGSTAKANVEETFPGWQLCVTNSGQFLPKTNNSIVKFDRGGLVMAAGRVLRYHDTAAADAKITLRGKMTIGKGSSSAPVYVKTTKAAPNGCTYVIESSLHGVESSYVQLEQYKAAYTGWSKLVLAGDSSDFKGIVTLKNDDNALQFDNTTWQGSKVIMAAPSHLILPTGGVLTNALELSNVAGRNTVAFRASSDWSYGRLRLSSALTKKGANVEPLVLIVPTDLALLGSPTVTNETTVGFTLIESPVEISASDYTLELTASSTGYGLVDPVLQVNKVGDDWHLQLVYKGPLLNYLLSGDSSSSSNHGSSFKPENVTNWSRGVISDPLVLNVASNLQLMTQSGIPSFAGFGLQIESSGDLAMTISSFSLDNLILKNGGEVDFYTTSTLSALNENAGRITVLGAGVFGGRPANDVTFVNNLPFVSAEDATLIFRHDKFAGTANAVYDLKLMKQSPDYLGKVTIRLGTVSRPITNGYIKVSISDPLALGGPRTNFADDALLLRDDMRLCALETMTFDDSSRGFKVMDNGRIIVQEGKTLTFNQPIRWAGVLKKEGAGTFARGGSTQIAVPVAASSFEICEGAVKPLVTNAFDGVQLVFKGGRLEIPVTNGTSFASYGLVTTRLDAPFATEPEAAIPLSFALPDGGVGDQTVAVCTVKDAETASALAGGGFTVLPGTAHRVALTSEQTDLGYTVKARIYRTGTSIFFR